uniref:DUF445 domain-containing protein n=1 Tax=Chrysotila carterae TaxID=13221 RepID=A0A7S4B4S3_CHRCT
MTHHSSKPADLAMATLAHPAARPWRPWPLLLALHGALALAAQPTGLFTIRALGTGLATYPAAVGAGAQSACPRQCTVLSHSRAPLLKISMCAVEGAPPTPPDGGRSLVSRLRAKPLLIGASSGAAAAVLYSGGAASRNLFFLLLRGGLLAWPFVAAVRLYRSGKRRAALTLVLSAAARRFCTRWWQYCTIPLFAGAVGWLTNKVAVDMIFYPVEFAGLPLKRYPEQPLGWIGWQGIVPAKAGTMATRLTELVTSKLVDVREVFCRLSPDKLSSLLAPGVNRIVETVVGEMVPQGPARRGAVGAGTAVLRGLSSEQQEALVALRHRFVRDLARDMQDHVDEVLDVKELVVGGMVAEKQLLINLFKRCGEKELAFLVNSGFGFGLLLGVFQMAAWIFYERAWTLAVGGAVVGYLTNWIALKLIFEPVQPMQLGPFQIQGMFLKRQHEVSAEFADCMTEKLLSSESLWNNILHGSGSARFQQMLHKHTAEFMTGAASIVHGVSPPTGAAEQAWWAALQLRASSRVMELLPQELPLVHDYVDETLQLRSTLKENLRSLSPEEFEGVLHPVFQEDELTLILVGSVLGLAVGYAQAFWDAKSKASLQPPPTTPDASNSTALDGGAEGI